MLTRKALLFLASMIVTLSGCGAPLKSAAATPPEPAASRAAPSATASPLAQYAFPASIDASARYVFYLHGKIIEDVGLPAVSPEFGEYAYFPILERLASTGNRLISEQREKDANPIDYAARLKRQVNLLQQAGVPAGHITVVGASKGAYIAALSSFVIKDPGLNFVLLATCYPGMLDEWSGAGMHLYGNVLAIYDASDADYAGSCEGLFRLSEDKGLGRHEEIVLHTGKGHGVVYSALEEWVTPTLEWIAQ